MQSRLKQAEKDRKRKISLFIPTHHKAVSESHPFSLQVKLCPTLCEL
jgi:hypothetical protein